MCCYILLSYSLYIHQLCLSSMGGFLFLRIFGEVTTAAPAALENPSRRSFCVHFFAQITCSVHQIVHNEPGSGYAIYSLNYSLVNTFYNICTNPGCRFYAISTTWNCLKLCVMVYLYRIRFYQTINPFLPEFRTLTSAARLVLY